MQILLTNDDGIFAPGLEAIYKKLTDLADVTVVAPATTQSGASHSITYKEPLFCKKIKVNEYFSGYSVEGSPADCVKLAAKEILKKPIDLVVSGINNGANTGINIYYSGTVAAAVEAAFQKIPSVSLSLAMDQVMDFDIAADLCLKTLKKCLPINPGQVININIPPLSKGTPKGIRVVPQAKNGYNEFYILQKNKRNQTVYQLAAGQHRPENNLADTPSLVDGYITVTPLLQDMTNYEQLQQLKKIYFPQNFT